MGADERDVRAGDITVLEGGLEEGAAGAFVAATASLKVAKIRQVRRVRNAEYDGLRDGRYVRDSSFERAVGGVVPATGVQSDKVLLQYRLYQDMKERQYGEERQMGETHSPAATPVVEVYGVGLGMNTNESKGRESEKSESIEHDDRYEAVSGSASDNGPGADERKIRSALRVFILI